MDSKAKLAPLREREAATSTDVSRMTRKVISLNFGYISVTKKFRFKEVNSLGLMFFKPIRNGDGDQWQSQASDFNKYLNIISI
jgi:hypothetical protein